VSSRHTRIYSVAAGTYPDGVIGRVPAAAGCYWQAAGNQNSLLIDSSRRPSQCAFRLALCLLWLLQANRIRPNVHWLAARQRRAKINTLSAGGLPVLLDR